MMYSLILSVLAVQCVYYVYAVRQRCSSPKFSCQFNNPCDPLCVGGQFYYPGPSDVTYIQCVGGECTEQRCPRRTTWNQDNLRCEGGNGLEARCAFNAFDCADRNPCHPTLCEQGVHNYPGPSPNYRYVSCGDGCSEEQCPRRQVWDQDAQRCVRKNRPTPPPDDRCETDIYNCEDHNPCEPEPCLPIRQYYEASDGDLIICTTPDNTCLVT